MTKDNIPIKLPKPKMRIVKLPSQVISLPFHIAHKSPFMYYRSFNKVKCALKCDPDWLQVSLPFPSNGSVVCSALQHSKPF